jgi:hypothetical protein
LPSRSPQHQRSQPKSYRDDELVVNYQDAVVYGRDVKLLESNSRGSSFGWLNDSLIHFRLLRLSHTFNQLSGRNDEAGTNRNDAKIVRIHAGDKSPNSPNTFLCLDPIVVSFFMHQLDFEDDPSEAVEFVHSNNCFRGIDLVFLPVNDSLTDPNWHCCGSNGSAPGTHWSLLVMAAASETTLESTSMANDNTTLPPADAEPLGFYHFDSVKDRNGAAAVAVATVWDRLWRIARHEKARADQARDAPPSPESTQLPPRRVRVHEGRAPQQSNGCDCGLHVLGSVEAILCHPKSRPPPFASHAAVAEDSNAERVASWESAIALYFGQDPEATCSNLRKTMAQDIRALASSSSSSLTPP